VDVMWYAVELVGKKTRESMTTANASYSEHEMAFKMQLNAFPTLCEALQKTSGTHPPDKKSDREKVNFSCSHEKEYSTIIAHKYQRTFSYLFTVW